MSWGTQQLVFDTTDATSIASSANVGAWVRSSSGALIDGQTLGGTDALNVAAYTLDGAGNVITSTVVGADTGLDVNILNDITVDLDGVYNVGTNPTPDSVGAILHTRAAAPDATNQTFRSTGGAASSDNVVAANVHGADVNSFMMGFDGTTWDRLRVDGSANLNVNINAATATVTVTDAALANTAILNTAAAIGGTSGALLASQLAARKYLYLANNGNRDVYVGTGTVTTANGFPLKIGSVAELRVGPAISVQAIAVAGGTPDVRALELS